MTLYLENLGVWGPLLLLLILSAQVILVIIPGHLVMITGGYLYGFNQGLTLNLLGTVAASQIVFVVVRWAGRPLAGRLMPVHLPIRWQYLAQQQGLAFFLFFFWFPILPSNALNFVAALSPISFWSFLAANFLGRLPGAAIMTLIGAYGLELTALQWGALGVVGLILFLSGRYVANKWLLRN